MEYKCNKCNAFFDESAISFHNEFRGECFGASSYENISLIVCPECGAVEDYEDAEVCEACGNLYVFSETLSSICPNCVKSHSNIDFCMKAGSEEEEAVIINGFLANMFNKEEIESILLRELKKFDETIGINYSNFIQKDEDWFGDLVVEEVRRNENTKK